MTIPGWLGSIHHDGSPRYVTQEGGTAGLRLRAETAAPIHAVFLRTAPDGEQRLTPMQREGDSGACQWWKIDLPRTMPRDGYRFFVMSKDGDYWLSQAGLTRHTPTDATDFKLLDPASLPTWVRDAVFYQIFPDRFADGDPSNNVRDGEYLYHGRPVQARPWDALPNRKHGAIEFFGGDLRGIVQKLDYLETLGVTAIYLTPIFTSPSNHKYDSATYDEVDPHFGGDAALVALREALHARGMHVMLDLVPNHTGNQHTWFRTAQADPASPEADFYTFHQHPHTYESWFNVPSLPKLNYRSAELRHRMYEGPHAIARHWLRPPFRIDGWRIDVANMLARQGDTQLGHKIGRGIRRAVKAENPHAFVLGENFYDGTPHLQGEELDATMNYRGFGMPVLQWLAGGYFDAFAHESGMSALDTEAMVAQWQTYLAAIPYQIALHQFNLLGSHDTPRVMSILDGNLARHQVARTLLYTFPGVPCVYYGDEIGLEGGEDPDNRRTMPWDPTRWNHAVLEQEQHLIQLRRASPALRWGGFQVVYAENERAAFLREAPEERLLISACRGAAPVATLDARHAGLAGGTRLCDVQTGEWLVVDETVLVLPATAGAEARVWRIEQEQLTVPAPQV